MRLFDGKAVFITGGTSGIGRATAQAFAREGGRVAVAGRREPEGLETVALIEEVGAEALFIQADVSNQADMRRAVEQVVSTFGRLDCAFNNAGVEADGRPLLDGTEALFKRIMNVNVKGVWLAMQEEIRAMLASGHGSIVNTASIGGLVGFAQASIYSASKHAVTGLTKAAALEYAAQGIRVNSIAPGTVDTPMFSRFGGEDPNVHAHVTAMHPIGRIARPDEIAEAVIWLCSDRASFVTGQTLAVDGGHSAQ